MNGQPNVSWPGTPPREQPTLSGAGIVLRPWRSTDADDVHAACQDPDIQRWTTVPSPYRLEDAVTWVSELTPVAWNEQREAAFAIVAPADGRLLGSCALRLVSGKQGVGEIGYWVAASARGRGVASDATRTLARWGFEEVGFEEIEIVIEPRNAASQAAAINAGATERGLEPGRCQGRDGHAFDALVFVLKP